MVISEIISKRTKENTDEKFAELVKEFNKTAIDLNSKYEMIYDSNNVCLTKTLFFGIITSIPPIEIFYIPTQRVFNLEGIQNNGEKREGFFYFYGGIDKEIFDEVRNILKRISQRFNILITGDYEEGELK